MLKAIWPSIQHLRNHLPESAKITTAGMRDVYSLVYAAQLIHFYCIGILCYFLYWLIQVRDPTDSLF